MPVNKRGGDVLQANMGAQGAGNYAEVTAASASGNAFLDGRSGDSEAFADANQEVTQHLDQVNDGFGGDGGDDNVEANTNIDI